jgi:hypothetical protein
MWVNAQGSGVQIATLRGQESAFGPNGDLFVDNFDGAIWRLAAAPQLTPPYAAAATASTAMTAFNPNILGIAVDAAGTVFAADYNNSNSREDRAYTGSDLTVATSVVPRRRCRRSGQQRLRLALGKTYKSSPPYASYAELPFTGYVGEMQVDPAGAITSRQHRHRLAQRIAPHATAPRRRCAAPELGVQPVAISRRPRSCRRDGDVDRDGGDRAAGSALSGTVTF